MVRLNSFQLGERRNRSLSLIKVETHIATFFKAADGSDSFITTNQQSQCAGVEIILIICVYCCH